MKAIKILGTGCAKCKQTEAVVREALTELGVAASVEKVEDIEKIMSYDVMSTPALVIDEQVIIRGKVPTKEEVRALLV
ncbi:MAG TPA: thioredoxin family protein [Pyrinomonadaceae bacterium]|nr:thioredoxin family protein [Pyrinomonadaceae bacterium]